MINYFEAIKILKSMEATAATDRLKNEALEIAINAINEVSTKKEYTTEMVDRYISVKEMPLVTPQPKTGHWIATEKYFMGAYNNIDYVECSCCGYESLEEGHYCPFCGAKMIKMIELQESEGKK